MRRSATLATALSAPGQPCARGVPCRLSHAEAGSIYYQCVYLRLHDDAPLHEAHAAVRSAFEAHHKPPFMPHCSLLYSDIDAAERARVIAEVRRRSRRCRSPHACAGWAAGDEWVAAAAAATAFGRGAGVPARQPGPHIKPLRLHAACLLLGWAGATRAASRAGRR